MPKVILSLDYDGNGCVLFPDGAEAAKAHEDHIQAKPALSKVFVAIRNAFEQYLSQITSDATVELYVGSNRQDHATNTFNIQHNKNGCCFSNYRVLAEAKGWTFRPLLLADKLCRNPLQSIDVSLPRTPALAAGASMDDSSVRGPYDKTKIAIIKHQLQDIVENHPGETIDFYFTDDDHENKIIPALKTYFSEHPEHIPPGITLHLVKFDWFPIIEKYYNEDLSAPKISDTIIEDSSKLIEEKASIVGPELSIPVDPAPPSVPSSFSSFLDLGIITHPFSKFGIFKVGVSPGESFLNTQRQDDDPSRREADELSDLSLD